MTDQEIEKLREKLGSEYSVKRLNGAITVELSDIWKGVEFASHIFDDEVYRVSEIVEDKIWNTKGTWLSKKVAKPSTEAAYVEQLKSKARELYGEIKNGDRFERYWIKSDYQFSFEPISDPCRNGGFFYEKEYDILTCRGVMIYEKGKWAKKVEEPVRVQFVSSSQGPAGGKITAWFQFEVSKDANIHSSGIHIAKCLEEYLNKSQ